MTTTTETKGKSLRQIAKQLDITPAYLSYMVNGKRPWRRDLFERYSYLVNTSVNTEPEIVDRFLGAQGGSRTHTPLRGADFKSAASTLSPPGPGTLLKQKGRMRSCTPSLSLVFRVGGDGRIRTAE